MVVVMVMRVIWGSNVVHSVAAAALVASFKWSLSGKLEQVGGLANLLQRPRQVMV